MQHYIMAEERWINYLYDHSDVSIQHFIASQLRLNIIHLSVLMASLNLGEQ